VGIHFGITLRPGRLAMRLPRRVLGVASICLLAGLAGCSSGTITTTTTRRLPTTTLPPLPPPLYAYVTTVGTGASIGLGHTVVPVNISPFGSGPQAPLGVGTYPDAIAITPNGERAYVANYTSNSVTPIDIVTDRVLPAIPLGPSAGPAGIAVAPDGKMVYVTDAGAIGTIGHAITPIVVATDRPLRRIRVGPGPQGIAITPNGLRAYVADAGAIVSGQTGPFGSTVTPVDLTTGKALPPITVGNAPTGIAITPDGSTAVVTNLNSGSVSTIDLADGRVGAPIAVRGAPIAVAISAALPTIAFVVDAISKQALDGNVMPINLATDTAGRPIAVGKNPQAIAMSPNGRTAWVVCFDNETIVPVNTLTRRVGTPIRVGGGPSAIAVTARPAAGTGTTKTPPAKKKT
jgi:YVTN family beta-propeller protein